MSRVAAACRERLAACRERLTTWRMNALGYRYSYNRAHDEQIVSRIWASMGEDMEDADPRRRRWSRATAQYRAQLTMRTTMSVWAFELACAGALPFFLLGFWIFNTLRKHNESAESCDGVQLVFAKRWATNPEIFAVPDALDGQAVITRPLTRHQLSAGDLVFIVRLMGSTLRQGVPFPFQFVLKCAVDLASVRAALTPLQPAFILVYWEFSCSLSVITQRMQEHGIDVYNIMHGDKHFYAKHAFFEVNRCYCWNQFYVDLFKQEHVRAEFHCFTNPAFVLDESEEQYRSTHGSGGLGIAAPHLATLNQADGNSEEEAILFADLINGLARHSSVTIRPHPFYRDDFEKIGQRLTPAVTIEEPSAKPARLFLLDHAIIVGTISTLLLEAAHIGCQVVVIETPAVKDLAQYHYFYGLENVRVSSLDTLEETIAAIDAQQKVGQTLSTAPASA